MAEAEEEVVVESTATPEQKAAAEKMGWIPETRYKGDPTKFVDADEYIKRGETVLPIVKEQNRRLHAEVGELREASAAQARALKTAQDAIEEMKEHHTVATQKAVAAARKELKEQLAAASEAGDHEAVADLTDQMTNLATAETEAKAVKKVETAPPPAFVPPPELREWTIDNPWFGENKRKTALALAIAQELREGGETSTGRVFFDKMGAEVDKELGKKDQPPGDKVEAARHGGDETRLNGKASYAKLPSDAKAACDADARRFVGEGKRYKTNAEWQARYAEIYFQG